MSRYILNVNDKTVCRNDSYDKILDEFVRVSMRKSKQLKKKKNDGVDILGEVYDIRFIDTQTGKLCLRNLITGQNVMDKLDAYERMMMGRLRR